MMFSRIRSIRMIVSILASMMLALPQEASSTDRCEFEVLPDAQSAIAVARAILESMSRQGLSKDPNTMGPLRATKFDRKWIVLEDHGGVDGRSDDDLSILVDGSSPSVEINSCDARIDSIYLPRTFREK
jgi:hypothetical protein